MTKHLKAVYEHGVFRPLESIALALEEHQEVTLFVTEEKVIPLDSETKNSCFGLAQALGLIGIVTDVPADLSTNKTHFEDFGRE